MWLIIRYGCRGALSMAERAGWVSVFRTGWGEGDQIGSEWEQRWRSSHALHMLIITGAGVSGGSAGGGHVLLFTVLPELIQSPNQKQPIC
jgi:hypothetical protein